MPFIGRKATAGVHWSHFHFRLKAALEQIDKEAMRSLRNQLFAVIFGACAAFLFPNLVLGAEKISAEQELKQFADYNLTICGTGARRAINAWRSGRQINEQYEFGDCIEEARMEGKKLYTAALAKVTGGAQAETALKEYFAMWLTALASVKPNSYETIGAYNDRQSDFAAKIELTWNKFELEH